MPLDDVRVVDLTRYTVGPFCTRLLADYGADVIKVEPPGGDPARLLPPFYEDQPGPERSGLFLFLNTTKRSVVIDLKTEAGRDQLLGLVRGADVLVENFRPGTMERLGLGYERLSELNPRLVMTSVTNFGQSGPYRDYAGTDLTLYAMGGNMIGSGDIDHEPLKTGGRMVGYHAAYVSALATAVALRAAEQRGEGEHLDISIFETATHSIDGRLARLMSYQHTGKVASRGRQAFGVGGGVYQCSDGYVLLTAGAVQLPAMLEMVGREDLLEQEQWATIAARSHPDRVGEFDAYLCPWTLERTKKQIREACEQFGVMGAPLNTVADLLVDESFRARGFFQQIDHPSTGPLTYPGYHFILHREEGPMPPRRRAPLLGEHTDELLGELATSVEARPRATMGGGAGPSAASNGNGRLPLEGLRILDFTVVYAGPYSTMHLADWGAEVIRVESLQHFAVTTRGTVARPPKEMLEAASGVMSYPDDDPGERPWNRAAAFNHHGRGKLSMTVDLLRPEGRDVFRRLVEISDGVVENNISGTADRLGLTWDELSKINPRLVLVRIPAFGIDTPYSRYRTYGNHMEALSGHPVVRAYPDLSLDYAPSGVPSDAASGVGSAFAFLMGLRQRDKTGKGLLVELSTTENFVPLMGEFIMDYTMNGRVWKQMGNDHFFLAPHNVYRCQGEDRWVTIAARHEGDWLALCRVMANDELARDPRFTEMAARQANRRELDAIIGEWTAPREPYWIMHRLQQAGVPAGVVMTEAGAYEDRQHQARGFWQEITHPEAGTHRHVGRAWRASDTPHPPPRHAPRLGEDNQYVYRELLGFSESEYRRFEQEGHIGMDYDPSVP